MDGYCLDMDKPRTLAPTIGANLRKIRKALGLTQEQVEEKTKRSQSSISSLERGDNLTQLDGIEDFIRQIGGDPLDLLRTGPVGISQEEAEVLRLWSACEDVAIRKLILELLRAKAAVPRSAYGIE
jgi:transcriptional regulator with XRE-family HTH domain